MESLRNMSKENAKEKFLVMEELRNERDFLMERKKEGYYLMYTKTSDSGFQTEDLNVKIGSKINESQLTIQSIQTNGRGRTESDSNRQSLVISLHFNLPLFFLFSILISRIFLLIRSIGTINFLYREYFF